MPHVDRFSPKSRWSAEAFRTVWCTHETPHSTTRMVCRVWLDWSWWRHPMETFSALLALCEGNSPVTVEFFTQRPVTRSFDINNREAGNLSRHRAHYDVTVICSACGHKPTSLEYDEALSVEQVHGLFSSSHLSKNIQAGSSCVLFIYDDIIKWKLFPRYWPFVRGIYRSPFQWLPF